VYLESGMLAAVRRMVKPDGFRDLGGLLMNTGTLARVLFSPNSSDMV